VMQQPVLLQPKFGEKSSHIFTQPPLNVTVVCEIDCFVCKDEFFVNNTLDVKENYEYALNFTLHLSGLLRSALNRARHSNIHVRLMFNFPNASLIIVTVAVGFFPRIVQT
jgi:hypothetical protein